MKIILNIFNDFFDKLIHFISEYSNLCFDEMKKFKKYS